MLWFNKSSQDTKDSTAPKKEEDAVVAGWAGMLYFCLMFHDDSGGETLGEHDPICILIRIRIYIYNIYMIYVYSYARDYIPLRNL